MGNKEKQKEVNEVMREGEVKQRSQGEMLHK